MKYRYWNRKKSAISELYSLDHEGSGTLNEQFDKAWILEDGRQLFFVWLKCYLVWVFVDGHIRFPSQKHHPGSLKFWIYGSFSGFTYQKQGNSHQTVQDGCSLYFSFSAVWRRFEPPPTTLNYSDGIRKLFGGQTNTKTTFGRRSDQPSGCQFMPKISGYRLRSGMVNDPDENRPEHSREIEKWLFPSFYVFLGFEKRNHSFFEKSFWQLNSQHLKIYPIPKNFLERKGVVSSDPSR